MIFVNDHFIEGKVRPNVPAVIEIRGIHIKSVPDKLPSVSHVLKTKFFINLLLNSCLIHRESKIFLIQLQKVLFTSALALIFHLNFYQKMHSKLFYQLFQNFTCKLS